MFGGGRSSGSSGRGRLERKRSVRILVAGIAASAWGAGAAGAQDAAIQVLEAPSTPSAMAWGNTPDLFADDPGLLFYTPALLSGTAGAAASLQRYGSEGTLASLAAAGPFQGGGFAVGLQAMRYEVSPGDPAPLGVDRQSVALTDGERGVQELAATLGYGIESGGWHAGIALKYVEVASDAQEGRTFAGDLGVARDLGEVRIGLALRNAGPNLERPPSPDPTGAPTVPPERELPTSVVAGLALEPFEVGPLDLFLTSRVTRRRDGEVIPAGGFELSYWPISGYTFRLRGGAERVAGDERSPITLGGAFTGDHITIEYAFQPFDGEGDAHRVGLVWR